MRREPGNKNVDAPRVNATARRDALVSRVLTTVVAWELAGSTLDVQVIDPRARSIPVAAFSRVTLCAKSAPAKGCVERTRLTLQDRLVKELRLARVSSIKDGNRFLDFWKAS